MSGNKEKFNLTVELKLGWKQGNEYNADVTVTLTDNCFHALKVRRGLPSGLVGLPEIVYVTYEIKRDEHKACGEIVTKPTGHIIVHSSDAKKQVIAYAEVNGEPAGHSKAEGFPRG